MDEDQTEGRNHFIKEDKNKKEREGERGQTIKQIYLYLHRGICRVYAVQKDYLRGPNLSIN